MNGSTVRRLLPLALLAAASACAGASPPASLQFDFHSSYLMNLHHRLYALARRDQPCPMRGDLAPVDQRRDQMAVGYYHQHFAQRDPVFDDGLRDIKRALARAADDAKDARGLGLAPELATILGEPGLGEAGCDDWRWAAADAANRAWIARVQALEARYGGEIQPELERAFGARFPARIVDEVVVDTGTFQGAYTDEPPPITVIPSGRADYDGNAALEMIWHEASHAGTIDHLEALIDAEAKAAHRDPGELWHAVLFYTVGTVTERVFKRHGVDYEPYATKRHLFERAWPQFLPLLRGDWQAWLDGRGTLDEAVRAMVAKLPGA